MAKSMNEWAAEIHENAIAHGWWDEPRSFGEIVALCHSELSEALEEHRDSRPLVYLNTCANIYGPEGCGKCELIGRKFVPVTVNNDLCGKLEGVAVEMIDCMIRILDWCGFMGVDVDAILEAKHEYNKTRPYRHGGKAL